jgi:predicted nucleic acid-binding protein
MIAAVVDTNMLVSGAIASHPNSASKGVVDAIFAGSFLLLLSRETLFELQRVLADEEIRGTCLPPPRFARNRQRASIEDGGGQGSA